MTKRLPSLNARDVMRALERGGFACVRSKGSHRVFEHRGKDIPRGTLHAIIEQAGFTVDEFVRLL